VARLHFARNDSGAMPRSKASAICKPYIIRPSGSRLVAAGAIAGESGQPVVRKLARRRYEQRCLLKNLANYGGRKNTNASCFPGPPVETLQLIGEDCSSNFEPRGNENFEGITLYPTRDWREHS
jgi:hypothetical protein